MAAKETKSPQEILHEMTVAERARIEGKSANELGTEIEMEGAIIRGGMPTFEYLKKSPRKRGQGASTGEIFQLPSGQKVVLVSESQLADFVMGKQGPDIKGLDSVAHLNSVHFTRVMNPDAATNHQNKVIADKRQTLSSFGQRDRYNLPTTARNVGNLQFNTSLKSDSKMRDNIMWEQRKRYGFYMDKRDAAWAAGDKEKAKFYKDLMDRNEANRFQKTETMRADKYRHQLESYERSPPGFAASELSGLGVSPEISSEGQFLTDKASVGTSMFNIDRNRDEVNELATYNLGQGFHLLLGVNQEYHQDPSSFGMFEMTDGGPVRVGEKESPKTTLPIIVYSDPKSGQIESDYRNDSGDRTTYAHSKSPRSSGTRLYDVNRNEIKPELIPGFTGRDVIEGYKTAKAGQRAKPSAPVGRPAPERPAPEPPPPAPPSPSSWRLAELPVVETLKGRRRMAKRRFSEDQKLSDE